MVPVLARRHAVGIALDRAVEVRPSQALLDAHTSVSTPSSTESHSHSGWLSVKTNHTDPRPEVAVLSIHEEFVAVHQEGGKPFERPWEPLAPVGPDTLATRRAMELRSRQRVC